MGPDSASLLDLPIQTIPEGADPPDQKKHDHDNGINWCSPTRAYNVHSLES